MRPTVPNKILWRRTGALYAWHVFESAAAAVSACGNLRAEACSETTVGGLEVSRCCRHCFKKFRAKERIALLRKGSR